jgi:hypothetical chaperone protein
MIDQELYKRKVFPAIGDKCPLTMRRHDGTDMVYRFRLLEYEQFLLNWQLAPRLNQPRYLSPVAKNANLPGKRGVRFKRLYALIRRNLSYHVLRQIEQAKIRLSDVTETTIDVPELGLRVPVTRAELEQYLQPRLREIEEGIDAVLERANVPAGEIEAVVATGGSARIPIVKRLLENTFGTAAVEHDTFGGVAAGLAIANYNAYPSPLDT